MKKNIQLSELVASGEFLEGSSLYHQKSVLIVSIEEKENKNIVKGVIKKGEAVDIEFSIDTEGRLLSKSCSAGCGGVCKHVVGLALLFNELSMENSDLTEQLSKLGTKKNSYKSENFYKIIIQKKDLQIISDPEDYQLKKICEIFQNRNLVLLVSLFPERFSLGNTCLKQNISSLTLFYETGFETVKFFFADHIQYFDEEGVVIDSETGEVWKLVSDVNETVSTLLRISVKYTKKDELIKAIADLSDNLLPVITLNGELNLKKIELDEDTEVLFDTFFENGKVCVSIFFIHDGEKIEFKSKRKNYDQNYPLNGKIYSLSPVLIKNIRNALSLEGFRQGKNFYYAPISKFSSIILEGSLFNTVGKVVSRKEIKRVSFIEQTADQTEIVLEINDEEKWFSFNIKLPESANFINSSELVSAVLQYEKGVNEPVVMDLKGTPVILEKSSGFLRKIAEFVFSDLFKSKEKVPMAHLLKVLKTKNKKIINNFTGNDESLNRYIKIAESLSKGELPEVKSDLLSGIPMRKYQIEGYKWFMLLRELGLGGILADEMGLGKTLQSLAMIKTESDEFASLVVCPKTLIWSWDMEIKKFFPEMKRVVIDSLKPEERAKCWEKSQRELIITSYAVLINDFKHLKNRQFKTVVLDEAQHIKNNNTKRFKIISSIKSQYRFALTGTPLENHVSDLWSIFQFVMPGYLGNRRDVDRIEKNNDQENLKKLSDLTAPFILRRTKRETLSELPELIINDHPVEMTAKQKEIYLSVLLRGRAEFIEKGEMINKIEILSILSKLRLAANHPSFVSKIESGPSLSGKIPAVMELTDEIISGGGSVLIFSQYVKMLGIISKALDFRNMDYFYMDGSTTERIQLVERFNKGEKNIFLLSLKVGGVGLNLTGADNVIIVDPWWNPATEEQAWSRAHRIGQEKKVIVNKLFSKGTIEEKILDLHVKKKGMTDFFLSNSLKDPSEDFVKMIADMELSIKERQ